MNIEDLQLQKLRLEMAANAISQIEIAKILVSKNPTDKEWAKIQSNAVDQYEGLMKSIYEHHQQKY